MSANALCRFDPRTRCTVRSCMRRSLQAIAGASGLPERITGMPPGATILMYHSVAQSDLAQWIDPRNHMPPECFASQMRFLARRRRVVALDALVEELESGGEVQPGTVVLTFDDGYLDNLHIAAEILDRLRLPATLFVPTGVIDRGENQWVDRLYAMIRARTHHVLELQGQAHNLAADARSAYLTLCRRLLQALPDERERLLQSVSDQLAPHSEPPRLTLTWEELRSLASGPFSIQSHGVDHLDLRSHASQAPDESARSRDRIRAELGRAPRHFSFPYGRSCGAARDAIRRTGYRSAVSDAPLCRIEAGVDRWAMPRVEAPASTARLAFLTSGIGRPYPRTADHPAHPPVHAEQSP